MIDQLPIFRFFTRHSFKSKDFFLVTLFIIIVCFLCGYSHIEYTGQHFFIFWICCHTLNFTFYVKILTSDITSDTNSNFIGK